MGKQKIIDTKQIVMEETEQDIFKLPEEFSLVHSIAKDFYMDEGISLKFKRSFGDIDRLRESNLKIGHVGLVNRHNQNVFYLITKKTKNSKSALPTVEQAFRSLLSKMKQLSLSKFGLSIIGYEFDGHNWSEVKKILIQVFDGSGIHIMVCCSQICQSIEDSTNDNQNIHNKPITHKVLDMKFKTGEKVQEKSGKNPEKMEKKKNTIKKYCEDKDNSEKLKNFNEESKTASSNNSFIKEIDEDLFQLPKEFSLAHCVAEDLRMGAGIAKEFKRIFHGIGNLIDQNLKIGDVGIVNHNDQIAFYLVTKKYSSGKPTMEALIQTIKTLVKQMKKLNLTKLGIPKIGCGLDGLSWDVVKEHIKRIFAGSGIQIIVCVPTKILDQKTLPPPIKVYITPNNLWEMEAQTHIVLLVDLKQAYSKNFKNDIIDQIDARYQFKDKLSTDIKRMKLKPGDITQYQIKNEWIICVFFEEKTFYSNFESAFKTICSSKKTYLYLAIQCNPIDVKQNTWIVLILRSFLQRCELWLCGYTQLETFMFYDQYCKNQRNSMDSFNNYSMNSSMNHSYLNSSMSSPFKKDLMNLSLNNTPTKNFNKSFI